MHTPSPVDILAIGAHPDDVELGCGGTLAKHVAAGDRVAILDLTRGEMGTRGTAELRDAEAQEAARVLGVTQRLNAGMRDGFLENSEANQRVLNSLHASLPAAHCPGDRAQGPPSRPWARLPAYCGLLLQGRPPASDDRVGGRSHRMAHRPEHHVYHYIQYYDLVPDFSVDITGYMDQKMASIQAHKSQFFDASSQEPRNGHFLPGIPRGN